MIINIDIKPEIARWYKKEAKKAGMARMRYIEKVLGDFAEKGKKAEKKR